MSIFSSILTKIFHHPAAATATTPETPATPAPSTPDAPQPTNTPTVDVGAVLADMAAKKNGGGNYKVSIVDLLTLLDLDHSLEARKQLAEELHVHAGDPGTAEQNIALHKAVVAKLAENGGKIPETMRA